MIVISDVIVAPFRHGIELKAVGELHPVAAFELSQLECGPPPTAMMLFVSLPFGSESQRYQLLQFEGRRDGLWGIHEHPARRHEGPWKPACIQLLSCWAHIGILSDRVRFELRYWSPLVARS